MKEKKSNLKNNDLNMDKDQKESIIRLVGLALIVYSILAFAIQDGMGAILKIPFEFLFGAVTPIVLLLLLVIGLYMLIFKKLVHTFTTLQYVLLVIAFVFLLILATATKSNEMLSFTTCFDAFLKQFKPILQFKGDTNQMTSLGGGIIGYMLFGLIQSITAKNYTLTVVISAIIFAGVIFILVIPYITRFVRFCKKHYDKNKDKREAKKESKLKKKEEARLKKEEEQRIVSLPNNRGDDLLQTTQINVVGEDYHYVQSNEKKTGQLADMVKTFDKEIYDYDDESEDYTKEILETKNVKLVDTFENEFEDETILNHEYKTIQDEPKEMTQRFSEENQTIYISDMEENVEEDPIHESDEVSLFEEVDKNEINYPENEESPEEEIVLQQSSEQYEEKIYEEEIQHDEKIIDLEDEETINLNDDEETNLTEMDQIVDNQLFDFNAIDYVLPPLYLLKEAVDDGTNLKNEEVAKEKASILMEKMHELNVDATINAFVVGPSVTRFEIALAPGVRVSSFTNLQEDFKLALGVNSIRIESPIPGKSAIGVEIPNQYRSMVSMKEIITKMPNKKHKLYVPVGKDIGGAPLSFPICDMPHCLISGATNSGKSVCANTIILSILMNYKPSEVRMIMVDPKRVEMLFYKDIPHLLCPIITDSEKARVALDKLCVEMNNRFTLFSNLAVKNIASYNELMVSRNQNKMPFILLIVDEFAELMLCKNHNLVEERIQKLAQLGRAAGIHLILSTQRPDVNVIPGTIKTNLPCRMTFRLSSVVDSRTVIDCGGAEKLLNNGDMLLLTPDFTGLRRVQGVYVSDSEISDVVEFCKKQVGPHYDPQFLDLRSDEEKAEEEKLKFALAGNNNNDYKDVVDLMYEEIKAFVIREQKASASLLQRKFGVGFNKAAKYVDMLEEDGIVGPENGSKPREVLIQQLDEDE